MVSSFSPHCEEAVSLILNIEASPVKPRNTGLVDSESVRDVIPHHQCSNWHTVKLFVTYNSCEEGLN